MVQPLEQSALSLPPTACSQGLSTCSRWAIQGDPFAYLELFRHQKVTKWICVNFGDSDFRSYKE